MRGLDVLIYTWSALTRFRMRTALILLAMAIGVASIVVLTALGEGARRYVTGEFASLGTHLLIVLPGRSETAGAGPAMFIGETPRDLTIADAEALRKHSAVKRVAPLMIGAAAVSRESLDREVTILGSTADLVDIRHWEMAQGQFLPAGDAERGSSACVLGAKVKRELFGAESALGKWVRIGDRRFRVIGILASEGRTIGVDVEDVVIIPVASAQILFNSPSLFRILVEAKSRDNIPIVISHVLNTIKDRHQGEEDITVITQDAVLSTFDRIFQALTLTVGGIAAISLAVAGILIMNIMLVAVSQRTAEIGLLKALGAPRRQIIIVFLAEATLLSFAGAVIGTMVGWAGNWAIMQMYPDFPLATPWWALSAGLGVALGTGLIFGAIPAYRASRLDPVLALEHK